MTSSEEEITKVTADEGIQQIPASVIRVTQPPAVADARDQLLRAIGQEAQHVADTNPGQASTALEALARAYALITTSTNAHTSSGGIPPLAGRSAPLTLANEAALDGSVTIDLRYL